MQHVPDTCTHNGIFCPLCFPARALRNSAEGLALSSHSRSSLKLALRSTEAPSHQRFCAFRVQPSSLKASWLLTDMNYLGRSRDSLYWPVMVGPVRCEDPSRQTSKHLATGTSVDELRSLNVLARHQEQEAPRHDRRGVLNHRFS